MWSALKKSLVWLILAVARGLVWWVEMLGKNPALSRDHGVFVWRELHERGRKQQAEKAALPKRTLRRIDQKQPPLALPRRGGLALGVLEPLPVRMRHRRWKRACREHGALFLSR